MTTIQGKSKIHPFIMVLIIALFVLLLSALAHVVTTKQHNTHASAHRTLWAEREQAQSPAFSLLDNIENRSIFAEHF